MIHVISCIKGPLSTGDVAGLRPCRRLVGDNHHSRRHLTRKTSTTPTSYYYYYSHTGNTCQVATGVFHRQLTTHFRSEYLLLEMR